MLARRPHVLLILNCFTSPDGRGIIRKAQTREEGRRQYSSKATVISHISHLQTYRFWKEKGDFRTEIIPCPVERTVAHFYCSQTRQASLL